MGSTRSGHQAGRPASCPSPGRVELLGETADAALRISLVRRSSAFSLRSRRSSSSCSLVSRSARSPPSASSWRIQFPNRLGMHAQLAGQVRDRPARLLGAPPPHRPLLQLHRVLAWCCHRSSLLSPSGPGSEASEKAGGNSRRAAHRPQQVKPQANSPLRCGGRAAVAVMVCDQRAACRDPCPLLQCSNSAAGSSRRSSSPCTGGWPDQS
jgi:hypothetical protein